MINRDQKSTYTHGASITTICGLAGNYQESSAASSRSGFLHGAWVRSGAYGGVLVHAQHSHRTVRNGFEAGPGENAGVRISAVHREFSRLQAGAHDHRADPEEKSASTRTETSRGTVFTLGLAVWFAQEASLIALSVHANPLTQWNRGFSSLFALDRPDRSSYHSVCVATATSWFSSIELYNLAEDEGEATNLATSRPELVRELDAMIDAYLADTEALCPVPNPDFDPATRKGLDAPEQPDTLFSTEA